MLVSLYHGFEYSCGNTGFSTMRNDRDQLVYTSVTYGTHTHRSEYVSYPSRRPYHRFRQRSLKPSKWVRNRQSSVRNQTSANGDDTSRYRYRYDLAFLAVYEATDSMDSGCTWTLVKGMLGSWEQNYT